MHPFDKSHPNDVAISSIGPALRLTATRYTSL